MKTVRRVLVIGAGIGGLTAGAALARRGIETVVVEIKPENVVAGVGLNLPGNALRALREIDSLEECLDLGYTFDRVEFHDSAANHLLTLPSKLGIEGVPANCALQRRDLARLLETAAVQAGAVIRYATTVDKYSAGPDGIETVLSDGSVERFDLVVAFDGIRSSFRKQLFGVEPVHSGYSVWRVALDRHPDVTRNMYFQGMGTKAGLFPLNDKVMYLLHVTPEPGNPRYDSARFADHLTEKLAGYTGLIGELRDGLRPGDDIVYAPIEEVFLPRPWHRDRMLVLGDAAHAMAPHRTQGAAMAIEDGVVLGEVLAEDGPLEDLLAEYTDRRFERCKLVQDASKNILLGEMNTVNRQLLDRQIEFLRTGLTAVAHRVDDALNAAF